MSNKFQRFDPSLHTLKVGTVIKIADVEFRLVSHDPNNNVWGCRQNETTLFSLSNDFIESIAYIAIPSPHISKAAASELKEWARELKEWAIPKLHPDIYKSLLEKLDSMTEL